MAYSDRQLADLQRRLSDEIRLQNLLTIETKNLHQRRSALENELRQKNAVKIKAEEDKLRAKLEQELQKLKDALERESTREITKFDLALEAKDREQTNRTRNINSLQSDIGRRQNEIERDLAASKAANDNKRPAANANRRVAANDNQAATTTVRKRSIF